jgi:hypothetical protein
MAAENFGQDEPRRFPGFRSFADEDDRVFDDWDDADEEAAAYGGLDEPESETTGRRAGRAGLLVGGLLCAALAVGATVSWPTLSSLVARRGAPTPTIQTPTIQAPAAQPAVAQPSGLTVEVAQSDGVPPAPPAVAAPRAMLALRGALNAIPAHPARTPPGSRTDRLAPTPPASAPPAPIPGRAEPPPPETAPVAPPRAELEAPPALRPAVVHVPGALDCGNVVSLAQDIVCRDPGLRAAELRVAEAYASALAAGASERRLRRDQVEWLNMREEAARHSKQAVENLYRQRLQQLDGGADAPPP